MLYDLLTSPSAYGQYPESAAGGAPHLDGGVLGGGGEHLGVADDSINFQFTGMSSYSP